MGKNKLYKFAAVSRMSHVLEPTIEAIKKDKIDYKGTWNKSYFKNQNPITLELGCGKGEYTVGLATRYQTRNFIGIDIKGNRIYIGAKQAEEKTLKNVLFLRTKVDFITHFFKKGEIDEIWLTFSDPQPNKPNKRLTSKMFIERYRQILKPNGIIHLKTDSALLYESTMKEIETHQYDCHFSSSNIYQDLNKLTESEQEILHLKTHYETLFSERGAIIKYCKFSV